MLEQGTIDLLRELGVGDRMGREGAAHHGIELRFNRQGHRIPLSDLTGGCEIMLYGQHEVVKNLIQARLDSDAGIIFNAEAVSVQDLESEKPTVSYREKGEERELQCDVIAGCDGFRGVCRAAIPEGERTLYHREYPFGWFGILAEAPPSSDELICTLHERGFALISTRSANIQRMYFQCDPTDDVENWTEERIWEELQTRVAIDGGWPLDEGPIVEKTIVAMRSFAVEPMQYGRLFLAGDSAHSVTPTGAKGMNLAVRDVRTLADALVTWYETGKTDLLTYYSDTCLRRAWKAQRFSWWMTSMLHRFPDDDGFQHNL